LYINRSNGETGLNFSGLNGTTGPKDISYSDNAYEPSNRYIVTSKLTQLNAVFEYDFYGNFDNATNNVPVFFGIMIGPTFDYIPWIEPENLLGSIRITPPIGPYYFRYTSTITTETNNSVTGPSFNTAVNFIFDATGAQSTSDYTTCQKRINITNNKTIKNQYFNNPTGPNTILTPCFIPTAQTNLVVTKLGHTFRQIA
jgi:hypothetical protein